MMTVHHHSHQHPHPYLETPPPPSVSPDSDDPHAASSSCSSKNPKKNTDAGAIGKWNKDKEGPVKNACLSCRTKKAKCDGAQPVCGQCSKKSLECVYVKSRRGGARKKREAPPPSALQEFLKRLDGLLALPDYSGSVSPGSSDANEDTSNVVRDFASRHEIFRCYYNEVHPFLPVMPPRKYLDEILPTLLPESPFLLAAQTIMSLVPHPRDQNPRSANSKRLRSAKSNALARQTMAAVERLIETGSSLLECAQALVMLSMWEWGQSGNVTRNRLRSGQAIEVAMSMGLHEMDKDAPAGRTVEGDDWRKDMARRTWWIVYTSQLSSALISGNLPVLGPDDPRVKVDYPVCSVSDNSWPNWISTMRHCSRVFGLVNTVYYSELSEVAAWGNKPEAPLPDTDKEVMQRKMVLIDREVVELMRQAEATAIIDLVPGGEEEVVRNQQLSARFGLAIVHVHIHRQQAFPEVSLFSKRICGLPQAPDFSALANSLDDSPMSITPDFQTPPLTANPTNSTIVTSSGPTAGYGLVDDIWLPGVYPQGMPTPWFSQPGGAASLYYPITVDPLQLPQKSATIQSIHTPPSGSERRGSITSSHSQQKAHKAWGVDDKDQAVKPPEAKTDSLTIFPPGVSLARCATAAHTIVRLEVLHRSAVIALWDGPPKWMPFCACGLVTGAYAFLLLALAVQAENAFGNGQSSDSRADEVEALLTNVKVILAGLEAYGVMWDGIDVMAGEVRAALEAATRLPAEVRAQIESSPMEDGADDYEDGDEYDMAAFEFPSSGLDGVSLEMPDASTGWQTGLANENQAIPDLSQLGFGGGPGGGYDDTASSGLLADGFGGYGNGNSNGNGSLEMGYGQQAEGQGQGGTNGFYGHL